MSAAKFYGSQFPFEWCQYVGRGTTLSLEILAPSDLSHYYLPPAEGGEF